jgi:hypothetical protein
MEAGSISLVYVCMSLGIMSELSGDERWRTVEA